MYKDSEKQKAFQRDWARRRQLRMSAARNELKKSGCVLCGETYIGCLKFHHIDPTQKSFTLGRPRGEVTYRTPEAIREEARKTIVLCGNCHDKVHGGVISLTGNEPRAYSD